MLTFFLKRNPKLCWEELKNRYNMVERFILSYMFPPPQWIDRQIQYCDLKNSWVYACSYHIRISSNIILDQDNPVQAYSAESFVLIPQLHKFYFSKANMANWVKWTAQALIIITFSAVDTYVRTCKKSKLGPQINTIGLPEHRGENRHFINISP